ncbi:MAG: hypothetical protein II377_04310 [Clostridia bacterium]|nr:hypothetical protein [Clostridia bacterium]
MKKILALTLAALMLLACVACGGNDDVTEPVTDAPATDAPETEAPETDAPAVDTPVAESALEILEKIWAAYPEDQKFMAAGGFGDNMNWEGAGSIPTDNQEALETAAFYFVMTPENIALVDEIAHLMHGMNTNTFTAGVFHLKDASTKNAFADSAKESFLGNHWMCGSPEQFVAIAIGDYVITAYGHAGATEWSANIIPVFVDTVKACYADATIIAEAALTVEE